DARAVRPCRRGRERRGGGLRDLVPEFLHLGRRARHLSGGSLRRPGGQEVGAGQGADRRARRGGRRARVQPGVVVGTDLEHALDRVLSSHRRGRTGRVGGLPPQRPGAVRPRGHRPLTPAAGRSPRVESCVFPLFSSCPPTPRRPRPSRTRCARWCAPPTRARPSSAPSPDSTPPTTTTPAWPPPPRWCWTHTPSPRSRRPSPTARC